MAAQVSAPEFTEWPVLRQYDREHSARIALPIGGIGTGTVSLGGRGDLRDWEVVNRPAKGWSPRFSFFAIRTAAANGADGIVARALEGPIDPTHYEGGNGSSVPNHGLPRFRHSEFHAAYPLGQVLLADPDVPVEVRLQAFNPLVPTDVGASGIPMAVMRYTVTNIGDVPLDVSVAGSVQNFVGTDGTNGAEKAGRNTVRQVPALTGVLLASDGVDTTHEQWGSLALAVVGETDVSTRTSWADYTFAGELLDFWDDFISDGHLDERRGSGDAPMASLVAKRTLRVGESHSFTYVLAWHFPNRQTWFGGATVGNAYATQYADAWQVIARTVPALPELERRTVQFVDAFVGSDLPDGVKEAALFNVSTLRTQTCFRTDDGRFFGWEGCNDRSGSCHGNCTHVWNYEQATPYLFGTLARSMRETEFGYGTAEDGLMSFRVQLPLDVAHEWRFAAADGQMGCLVKLYREWRLSGDDAFLRDLWPSARKALEFAWVPGGWDADRDGVMEGCQHNTMDVEYFGPNPEIGVWYLAALRACEEMARYLGEDDFAETCADMFRRGSEWIDEHLFNGAYYVHEIRPPGDETAIAPGLRLLAGARDLSDPELQIGDGCLADQLVGQVLAHAAGLGYLLDRRHIQTTLQSILRYNRRDGLTDSFNPMRSFALGDEPGLTVASYPKGNRPTRPFPYFAEVWTGLEYTAAAGMFYENMHEQGAGVVEDVRSRFDGRRRNPFNEAECGHHYVRAVASWGSFVALTGFGYDAATGTIRFASSGDPVTWFWSNGQAWGTMSQQPAPDATVVGLDVHGGSLRLCRLVLTGAGSADLDDQTLTSGQRVEIQVPSRGRDSSAVANPGVRPPGSVRTGPIEHLGPGPESRRSEVSSTDAGDSR